ncbi:MAG: hydrogenobyrinic acid a,c-diamide synthase (glutamine-hydrolyzing) [Desulfobacteraceae bacterium]|nr:MAG: hydrogenobyrinic acid a,c-diamide synthase (glutamine-hydrolyzing) [Desulfobacteraceae bacterium]
MIFNPPRIIIAALKGGSGKTILSLGLTSAWREMGHRVAAFKKGPDFIDSGWLSFAAARPCFNLDPFLMNPGQIVASLLRNSAGTDISVIEGNRGLFDGLDVDGCCSTGELGKIIKSPVLLIVDVTMATRTVAALVMGCQKFDPDLRISGVILNRVAGLRQESLARNAVEQYCGIPVVGAVPKLKQSIFPERHMGLVPHLETDYAEKAVAWARGVAEKHLDLKTIWNLAHEAPSLDYPPVAAKKEGDPDKPEQPPRIGVIKDKSFWFYYPENLDQIKSLGASLIEMSSLEDRELPAIDALYIGGGFPETQAQALADNVGFRTALKQRIEEGLPVYAECGGLMVLGKELVVDGKEFPMVGALPLTLILEKRPQGHGYTVLEVTDKNPYYPIGEVLKGHEFHYSKAVLHPSDDTRTVFKVLRGEGIDGKKDGLCRKNVLATYTHIHAGGNPEWAARILKNKFFLEAEKKS